MSEAAQHLKPALRLAAGSKIEYLALGSLLIVYLLVALAHAYLAPLTTGPDELAHYEYINFIAEHGRLPLNNQERAQARYKSDQPPLYHLLAALPVAVIDPAGPPYLKRVDDHPRRQLIERTRHAWGLYNTEDEQWPYRAEVLRWQAGRWLAILFGAATVMMTFFTARAVFAEIKFPGRPPHAVPADSESAAINIGDRSSSRRQSDEVKEKASRRFNGLALSALHFNARLALAAAAVVAFIPRFILTGSMLNYETTLAFFAALFLWILLHIARDASIIKTTSPASTRRPTSYVLRPTSYVLRSTFYVLRPTFSLGLFAGLALAAKLSALILPLEIVIGLGLIARYRGWPRRQWLRAVAAAAVGTLVGAGWWFGFVVYQFNTVAQDGWWTGLLRPLIAADASDATTNRLLNWLTGGQAGFTGALENLNAGPPWTWAAVFFRTFWRVGIEQQQPLGWFGLATALGLCLGAAYGLVIAWRQFDRRGSRGAGEPGSREAGEPGSRGAEEQRSREAGEQRSRGAAEQRSRGAGEPGRREENTQYAIRNTQYASHPTPYTLQATRLMLLLLLLHLFLPFTFPLIRYVVTFSLADTAQGRHVLFLAAPAFAILLVWGWSIIGYQLSTRLSPDGSRVIDARKGAGRGSLMSERVTGHGSRIIDARKGAPPASRLTFLLPPLFLLCWSLVQLWTMTWAYHPLLPVRTVPAAKAQATQPVDRVVNEYVTLVGFDQRPAAGGRLLRLNLIWQATGVSPVDYLTEARLLDAQGSVQAHWLGYPAGGRYPTRAWDGGDIVRDTVWLPVAGLPAGRYTVTLNLAANHLHQPANLFDPPLALTTVDLAETPERATTPQVWQDGRPLSTPQLFNFRETVLVTLGREWSSLKDVSVRLLGPRVEEEQQVFEPTLALDDAALFIVGPDWPSGDYRLQLTAGESDEAARSRDFGPVVKVIDRWRRRFDEPAMQRRLEANFANQVKLLGYDLGANRVEPGGGVPLTLYWQGLDWLGADYTMFVKLLAADQTVHGGRDRLPQEGYRTLYWAPGEIVVDPFGVPVAAGAPDGIYTINIGLYKQIGEQAVSLPLVQDGRPVETTSINIGPVKIGDAPPGLTVESATPQVRLEQPFGDAPHLTLLGYDLTDHSDNPTNLHLTLYWRSEAPLPVDYTTFVHLRSEAGDIAAQKDQPPLDGAYPASLWDSGEIIADEIMLPLPTELSAGRYTLLVGLYDFKTGERLPVPNHPHDSLPLATLELK